jgi:alkylation response protein AidB-like acyl-CoA dehydrogenase
MTQAQTRLIADIRQLAPQFAARAAEFEAARRIPDDVVAMLRDIGVFRMFVPRRLDGMELDLAEGLDVITTMARIDGSLGWAAMVAATPAILAPLLPRATYDAVYRNGPDVRFSGSGQPSGTAESVPGGWRVNGRWPFMSGCDYADWMVGTCVMTEGGKPLPGSTGAEGPPMIRAFMLPRKHWRIEDTWHVAGLTATGSHHGSLEDVFVPDENLIDLFEGQSCEPGPLYQAGLQLIPTLHASVHLGLAEGALDDLIAMAQGGRQQFRVAMPMRESELFQYELGRTAADVRAMRATFQAQVADDWRRALTATLRDDVHQLEATQTAVWISAMCCRAVDACFVLGGGSAVYDSSPLQRRMRDAHVAAQHATVQQRHYADIGRMLLGKPASGH